MRPRLNTGYHAMRSTLLDARDEKSLDMSRDLDGRRSAQQSRGGQGARGQGRGRKEYSPGPMLSRRKVKISPNPALMIHLLTVRSVFLSRN